MKVILIDLYYLVYKMETYQLKKLDNMDYLLQKIMIPDDKFTIVNEYQQPEKYEPKTFNIDRENMDSIKLYDFNKSEIVSCDYNYAENYISLLSQVYKKVPNEYDIVRSSIIKDINFHNYHNTKTKYTILYIDKLVYHNICFNGLGDSNKCLAEIVNQCDKNNISLSLIIKLTNNDIVKINM